MERISFKTISIGLLLVSFFILIFGYEDCNECYSFGSMAFRFFLIGLIFIGASFYYFYKWYSVDSILFRVEREPISKINMISREVPTSFYGNIESKETIVSPYTKTSCVFYHYIREKYVQSDNGGYWDIVNNEIDYVPFQVNDGTGKILVSLRNVDSDLGKYKINKHPADSGYIDYSHSEVDAVKAVFQNSFTESRSGFLGFKTSKKFRVSEYVLVPEQKVFVYGWVYEEDGEKIVAESDDIPLILSRKTKEEYLADFAVGEKFFYTHNLLLYIGVILSYFSVNHFYHLNPLILLLLFALVSLKMILQIYNRIVFLRNRIFNAKSQIDIELKKRYELIPLLQEIVKAYSKYEGELNQDIARLRKEFMLDLEGMKKYAVSQKGINKSVILLAESYPKLRASQNFKNLMDRLARIEENIAYYRGFYNKTALKYNNLIGVFPVNVLAKISGFRKEDYWSR